MHHPFELLDEKGVDDKRMALCGSKLEHAGVCTGILTTGNCSAVLNSFFIIFVMLFLELVLVTAAEAPSSVHTEPSHLFPRPFSSDISA